MMRALLLTLTLALAPSAPLLADDVIYPRHDERSGQTLDIPLDRACLDDAGQAIGGEWLLFPGHRDRADWESAQQLAAAHCVLRRLRAIEAALAHLLEQAAPDD